MKNLFKKILFVCFSIVTVLSCTTNEYEDPKTTNAGRAFGIHSFDKNRMGGTTDVRINSSVVKFKDVSILSTGRTWSITGTSEPDIVGQDNNTSTDLQEFNLVFRTVGTAEVTLTPTFDNNLSEDVKTESFSFNVLPQIQASLTTDLPLVDGFFEVEVGADVSITNTSSEKNNAEWLITNIATGEERDLIETIDLFTQFKSLGDFTVRLRAFAGAPFSESFVTIPIRAIRSSQPLASVSDIMELEDETLQIPLNGELFDFSNQESFFSVSVNGVNFDIASITKNATDPSLVEIKLVEPIYRPDVITVSYLGGGDILSTDGRPLAEFADLPVVTHNVNLWDDNIYGFEDNSGIWVNVLANGNAGEGDIEYSTEQAASGTYSMKITSLEGQSFVRASGSNHRADLEANTTYLISYKVWIQGTPAPTAGSFGPWLFWTGNSKQFWKNFAHPKDQWVEFNEEITTGGSEAGPAFFTLRVSNGAVIYLDDVRIIKKEERP